MYNIYLICIVRSQSVPRFDLICPFSVWGVFGKTSSELIILLSWHDKRLF